MAKKDASCKLAKKWISNFIILITVCILTYMLNMLVAIVLIHMLGMLRCSKFRTGRLVCSKFSLEKAMKFAFSGSLTSLIRHLGLWEAKYLSQKGFRKRPLTAYSRWWLKKIWDKDCREINSRLNAYSWILICTPRSKIHFRKNSVSYQPVVCTSSNDEEVRCIRDFRAVYWTFIVKCICCNLGYRVVLNIHVIYLPHLILHDKEHAEL